MLRSPRFSAPAGRRLRLLTAAAAALLVALPSPAQTVEREMFVSVLDQAGTPVTTLGVPDFIVREDGRVREVLRARRASESIDIALLIDNSQALGNQVNDVRKGLEAFIALMRPHAQISIIGLGDRPTIYADYTNSAEQLARGIGFVFPIQSAGAYILDAVEDVLKGLEKRKPERSAVVVVFVGGREFSTGTYQPLIDGLKARGTSLNVLTVTVTAPPDIQTTEGRNRELLFDRGSSDTGGWRDNVLTSMAVADALGRLAAELLAQYRITFARPDALIPPQKTEVSVRQAGLKARGILIPQRAAGK